MAGAKLLTMVAVAQRSVKGVGKEIVKFVSPNMSFNFCLLYIQLICSLFQNDSTHMPPYEYVIVYTNLHSFPI